MKLCDLNLTEATIFDERYLINHVWENPRELKKWLRQAGYKKIGQGSYAEVYQLGGSNRIVKISTREDLCWVKFAKYCLRTTSNPNVPKIDWLKTYHEESDFSTSDQFFVTIMEKLVPISNGKTINSSIINDTVDFVGLVYINDFIIDLPVKAFTRRCIDEGLFMDSDSYETRVKKIDKFLKNNDSNNFIKTMRIIDNMEGDSCVNDIHEMNIMYRPSTKNLVITDPLN